jgi:hypothetical protein
MFGEQHQEGNTMSNQPWVECLSSAQVAGPTLASFTTAASILPTHARHTISADDWALGKSLWIRASGQISNVITAQPTFTFNFCLGTVATPIIVFTTGAILCSTTAHTTVPWWLDIQLTCRALGSGTAANLFGQAIAYSRAFIDSGATADITTLGHPTLLAPETTPAVGTGFDSNLAQVSDLMCACSVSNAANTIRLEQYQLLSLN